MGIRDYVNSTTEAISGGVARSGEIIGGAAGNAAPYLSGAWQSTRNLAKVASESAVWTGQAVAEKIPDREGVEKFGRLAAGAATPYLSGAWQSTRSLARVASESAVWTGQAVAERMPDREGWEKAGRVGLRVADHAIDHVIKSYTFGMPLSKIIKEEFRSNKSPVQVQPVKEEKGNVELAALKAKVNHFEQRMGSLEKKVEINHNGQNQKGEKRPTSREWCPPHLIDLIKIE